MLIGTSLVWSLASIFTLKMIGIVWEKGDDSRMYDALSMLMTIILVSTALTFVISELLEPLKTVMGFTQGLIGAVSLSVATSMIDEMPYGIFRDVYLCLKSGKTEEIGDVN
jgi:hypothetical protein